MENPESWLPQTSHWPSMGGVIAVGHAPEQGRAARRRAVWKHRASGSLLLVSRVVWGGSPDLSLPQFPHWQNGGVNAA